MMICQCGCGGQIEPKAHHRYRPPRFLPGHQVRGAAYLKSRKALTLKPPKGLVFAPLCACGCGGKTPIARQSKPERGQYKGFPIKYLHGHNVQGVRGADSRNWKGGVTINLRGYRLLNLPDHHLANSRGYVFEHRLVWEQTHNELLKRSEHIHHIDGNPSNNSPDNLIRLTSAEHMKLHGESGETRSRHSASNTRRYLDPAKRAITSEAITKWWAERKKKTR